MTSTTETKQKEASDFVASPQSEWTLISQGAEARVWKLQAKIASGNALVVCKERFSKAYRHPDLDAQLTKSRCRSEAKILEKCVKKTKIRVPKVIRVSPPSLFLEYLDGSSVKAYLQDKAKIDREESIEGQPSNKLFETELAYKMGELVGRLHNVGIVHGDLTTSNMMMVEDSSSIELALIDFGLSKSTSGMEEQAVDLYVLERALISTHPDLPDNFFDLVLEKYKLITEAERENAGDNDDTNGGKNKKKRKTHTQTALQRLEQVRMRGRKRECFG